MCALRPPASSPAASHHAVGRPLRRRRVAEAATKLADLLEETAPSGWRAGCEGGPMLPAAAAVLFVSLLLGAVLRVDPDLALLALAASTALALAALRFQADRARRARPAALVVAALLGLSLAPPSAARLPERGSLHLRVERRRDSGAVLLGPGGARVHASLDVEPGALLEVSGTFRARLGFRNPSPHGAWPALAPVEHRLEALTGAEVLAPPSPYRRAITAVGDRLRDGIAATLPPEAAGIARALVLGESEGLDEDAEAGIRDRKSVV